MKLKTSLNSKLFNIINIQSILLASLPFLLITGPLLSDLAVSLISILFLIKMYKDKKFSLIDDNFFKLFFIFWIYLLINSLLQYQNFDSLKISFFYIRFGLFVYATILILNENIKVLEYFFLSLLICFLILICDGFFQFFTEKNFFGFPLKEGPRVSSLFGDEQILGSYLSRLFPILFGLFLIFKNKFKDNIFYTSIISIFILSEALVFLSGERTAFFFMNLSIIFMFIFLKNFKKTRLLAFTLSVVTIIFIIQNNPNIKNRMINLTIEQMDLKSYFEKPSEKKIIIFSSHHNDHYQTAINMFYDNKFFGVGVKNFRKRCSDINYSVSEISCSTHPHNSYIQLLSETGLVGFMYLGILLSVFILIKFKHMSLLFSKKKYLLNDFQICLMSAILITIWPFAPTGNFFNNWLSIIYYLPVGIFLWSINNNQNNFLSLQKEK